jgi:hypothetical protein
VHGSEHDGVGCEGSAAGCASTHADGFAGPCEASGCKTQTYDGKSARGVEYAQACRHALGLGRGDGAVRHDGGDIVRACRRAPPRRRGDEAKRHAGRTVDVYEWGWGRGRASDEAGKQREQLRRRRFLILQSRCWQRRERDGRLGENVSVRPGVSCTSGN